MSPWKVILATMVIFGCGVLTGALVVNTGHRHPQHDEADEFVRAGNGARNSSSAPWQLQRGEFFKRLENQLDLTPDQRGKIDKIMHASQERIKPLEDQIAPQMRAEMEKVREEILTELNPDQQKKFAELLKNRQHRPPKPLPGTGQQLSAPKFTNLPPPFQTNQP